MMKMRPFVPAVLVLFLSVFVSAQDVFQASRAGDIDKIKALLAADASLANAKDAMGNTPIHHAAAGGSAATVEFLISRGAAIDGSNAAGQTPLHVAINAKRPEAAMALIAKGADVRKPMAVGRTPLHLAIIGNLKILIGPILAKGADLESREQQGLTPLMCAVLWSTDIGVARELIDKGADIQAQDTRGQSILDLALGGMNAAAHLELLLDRGAAYAPGRALSILQAAAAGGAVPLFRRMVDKHGDSLFADAAANRTTMTRAVRSGSVDIVRLLLGRGIPIDPAPNANGFNLLHQVAEIPEAAGLIDLLVKNGLDIDARTADGRSAYNLAAGERNREARRRLEALGANREPQKFPVLTGPYLGQTPPTGDPLPFARGIVIANHGGVTMSPDGREMYWSSRPSPEAPSGSMRIIMTMLKDGRWTAPAVAPFSCAEGLPYIDGDPFVSPDNTKLFFVSTRPIGSVPQTKNNIWYVERTAAGWSDPQPLGPEVNSVGPGWQFSVSRSGALYFGNGGRGDIYCSRLVDGKYQTPVSVGPAINSGEAEDSPFIAPDESYLIFFRLSGPDYGYHISYRLADGQWSAPAALKQLRSHPTSFVSPDGKYLFFGYSAGYWVPATFIEELRPKR